MERSGSVSRVLDLGTKYCLFEPHCRWSHCGVSKTVILVWSIGNGISILSFVGQKISEYDQAMYQSHIDHRPTHGTGKRQRTHIPIRQHERNESKATKFAPFSRRDEYRSKKNIKTNITK